LYLAQAPAVIVQIHDCELENSKPNMELMKLNIAGGSFRDPTSIFVAPDLTYALVGGDTGAYRFDMATKQVDPHFALIPEPVSISFADATDEFYVLSDDVGIVYSLSNFQDSWEKVVVANAAINPLLNFSERGQGAFDVLTHTMYTTNQHCDCILKVGNRVLRCFAIIDACTVSDREHIWDCKSQCICGW
jgi:hypothetical protein